MPHLFLDNWKLLGSNVTMCKWNLLLAKIFFLSTHLFSVILPETNISFCLAQAFLQGMVTYLLVSPNSLVSNDQTKACKRPWPSNYFPPIYKKKMFKTRREISSIPRSPSLQTEHVTDYLCSGWLWKHNKILSTSHQLITWQDVL